MTESKFNGTTPKLSYAWSPDGENYHWLDSKTLDAAKADAKAESLADGRSRVWVAEEREAEVYLPCVEQIIDDIRENTQENHGEWAEDFLDKVSPESLLDFEAAFHNMVGEWLTRNKLWPGFFEVGNPTEISEVVPS